MSAPEFGGVPMTKREVLIAREAFVRGAEWYLAADDQDGLRRRRNDAAVAYPFPTVKRPRVMDDPDPLVKQQWRVSAEGYLESRRTYDGDGRNTGWRKWREFRLDADFAPLPARVTLWADLFANPIEEVMEDAP